MNRPGYLIAVTCPNCAQPLKPEGERVAQDHRQAEAIATCGRCQAGWRVSVHLSPAAVPAPRPARVVYA